MATGALGSFRLGLAGAGVAALLSASPASASYFQSSISRAYPDITGTGTNSTFSDDQLTGPIPLGFSFDFFGNAYTSAYISSNGFLTFTPQASGCCDGMPIPTAGDEVNNFVAGAWTDLYPPAHQGIFYETIGSPGSRQFIVQFDAVPTFRVRSSEVNFELTLNEGSNNIYIQYRSLGQQNHAVTAGIENLTGTDGNQLYSGPEDATFVAALQNQGFCLSPNGADCLAAAPTQTPEPSSLVILAPFALAFGIVRRRQSRSVPPA